MLQRRARESILPSVTLFRVKKYAVPRFRRQQRAVVLLQSFARYINTLNYLERLFVAVAQIQVFMRGYIVRKRYLRRRSACLVLQYGRWMVAARRNLATQRRGASRVQAGWRGYCARMRVTAMRRGSKRLVNWWQ